jgi:hypothetical protein
MPRWHSSEWMQLVLVAFAFTDAHQHPLGTMLVYRKFGEEVIYALTAKSALRKPQQSLESFIPTSFSSFKLLIFNLWLLLFFVLDSVCPRVNPWSWQALPLVPVWLRF